MSSLRKLYSTLPEPLTASDFSILYTSYLEGDVSIDDMTLACMSRVLIHLEFVYVTDNLSMNDFEEAYSIASLKIVELLRLQHSTVIQNPAAYIFNISKNILVDLYRNPGREETISTLDNLAMEPQENNYIDLIDTLCGVALDTVDINIIKLRAQGVTNREISETLGLSPSTVSLRLNNLYQRYQTEQEEV